MACRNQPSGPPPPCSSGGGEGKSPAYTGGTLTLDAPSMPRAAE
ncbi:hypothetical protein [Streptomyces xanthophaeus]